MSADLFAEFGSFSQGAQKNDDKPTSSLPYTSPQNTANDPFAFLSPASPPAAAPFPPSIPPSFQSTPSSTPWMITQNSTHFTNSFNTENSWASLTGASSNSNAAQGKGEEDDGWGDFEVASPVDIAPPSQNAPAPSFPLQTQATRSNAASEDRRTRIVRASTLDLISNNLIDVAGPTAPISKLDTFQERPSWESSSYGQPTPPNKNQSKPKNSDPNVLFDAEDYDPDEALPDDEEDDFGDFETVVSAPKPSVAPSFDLMSSDWDSTPSTAPAPSTRREPPSQLLSTLSISNNAGSYPQAPKSPGFQDRNPFPGLAVTTPHVDQFPKEAGEVTSPPTAWPTVADPFAAAAAKKTSSFADDWGAFDDLAASQPQQPKTTQQPLGWDWDAADSMDKAPAPQPRAIVQSKTAAVRPPLPSKAASKPAVKPTTASQTPDAELDSSWDWDATDEPAFSHNPAPKTTTTQAPPDTTPAPTNIPPPSILLTLFPSLLDLPNTALFQPTSSTPSIRARVLADPQTATFLRGFLALATVAARIIAGRKLRWQRDRFLSQRMAISEVGGKGGRGMKLASIDRSQATRDDQAMQEVLDVWRAHIGKLRSAVAAANGADTGAQMRVPELGEGMTVQLVKGAQTAPKPCVVCGVKRDERVKGVDVEVEDSFGEWWVEHWGHRACRNFWYEHEEQLRSR